MAKKTAKKSAARKPNAAFMKPMTPSAALSEVVGSKPIPRTEVTKKLWAYIKKNKLQDAKNRRNIKADDALKAVFGGKAVVNMFEMTKLVNKHLKGLGHPSFPGAVQHASRAGGRHLAILEHDLSVDDDVREALRILVGLFVTSPCPAPPRHRRRRCRPSCPAFSTPRSVSPSRAAGAADIFRTASSSVSAFFSRT